MEYWYVEEWGTYLVTYKDTGDLFCKPNSNTCVEFKSVEDILAQFPDATFCEEM